MSTVRHPRRVSLAAHQSTPPGPTGRCTAPGRMTGHDARNAQTLKFARDMPIGLPEDLRLGFGFAWPWRVHG